MRAPINTFQLDLFQHISVATEVNLRVHMRHLVVH